MNEKIYIVWQLSNDSHYISGIYTKLEDAQAQKKTIENEWPSPSIYSLTLNLPRVDPDWGDFVE